MTDDTAPPISLLDALHAELRDYEARRAAFLEKRGVDAEYRVGILKMWDAAMRAQRARIAREENH